MRFWARWNRSWDLVCAIGGQVLLRACDEGDRPLVGLAGTRSEGHEAVVKQDEPDGVATQLTRNQPSTEVAERVTRLYIWNDDHQIAVSSTNVLLPGRRVGERQDGLGVGVVDVAVGEDRVEKRFDRGRRRVWIQRSQAERSRHVAVGQLRELGDCDQLLEPQRGEAVDFDRAEVVAAAFDAEDLGVGVGVLEAAPAQLHGRVAAAG